jgi:2-amino-4-hydroxy-6-hydroxymethyldihydropteridine pyrophosphokinase
VRKAARNDDLSKTVNYDEAAHLIERIVKAESHDLIETVAENVAMELLLHFQELKTVSVKLSKPEAPIELEFEDVSVEIERSRHTAYLSIGSNLGDKENYLDYAIEQLGRDELINVENVSSYIITEPVGPIDQPDFLNGAVEISTLYSPHRLLKVINAIESGAGRERIIHWGPRTLDIDIILFDDVIISDEKLTIPHKEMTAREFVLKPLSEIAPYAFHPILHRTVKDLYADLKIRLEHEAELYDVDAYTEVENLKEDAGIVYCGVPGAYAESAAKKYFGEESDVYGVKSFDDVVSEVVSGKADYGVLPIENSSAGFVAGIYDIIRNSGVNIVGEVVLDIEHALLGLPDAVLSDIRKVYSHPQGLMQCKDYIDEHGFTAESVSNTAVAAKRVMDKKNISEAAIASERAAELYGLKILARRINFLSDNSTRFVIISNRKIFLSTADKISISFTTQHKAGALYDILGRINENGINMTSIESRPSLRKKWEYVFYVSFEGKLTDKNVRKALGEILSESREMEVLGTF